MSLFSSFLQNRRGNVAVIFALALVPVVGSVGVALDYSRITDVRMRLADALDAAVLAVGAQPPMSQADTMAAVREWVDSHMAGVPYTLDSVTLDGNEISAVATSEVDMTLARVLGVEHVPVSISSSIVRNLDKVELALVLDNTGSMKGTKIATLRDAASQLVTSLAASTLDPADLRVGLVPFSMTVNVGADNANAAWMDTEAKSPIAGEIFTKPANRFNLLDQMKVKWAGCVESRPYPYDVNVVAPDPKNPATLYVPYFAPDEPDKGGSYNNDYLKDAKGDTAFADRQGNPAKYTKKPKSGTNGVGYQFGPNAGCELAPIQRLTTDTAAVVDAIGKMNAVGDTNIPMGLHWGWNILAEKGEGPFGDGVAYDEDEWQKVVVLMTDGLNQNTGTSNQNSSVYSGIGYIWQDRIGVGSGSNDVQRREALDGRLAELCSAMKAEGITIYTVRVEVKSGSSEVLENCASSKDKFYDVQNVNQLVSVFQDIGGSIQKLRIAR